MITNPTPLCNRPVSAPSLDCRHEAFDLQIRDDGGDLTASVENVMIFSFGFDLPFKHLFRLNHLFRHFAECFLQFAHNLNDAGFLLSRALVTSIAHSRVTLFSQRGKVTTLHTVFKAVAGALVAEERETPHRKPLLPRQLTTRALPMGKM